VKVNILKRIKVNLVLLCPERNILKQMEAQVNQS
jgi:hypothetical protein